MKLLRTDFVANYDKSGDNHFVQVKLSDKAAVYSREHIDGTPRGYEVFKIKVVKAGTPLPGGNVVDEDYVQYPGTNAFGRTAWYYHGTFAKSAALHKFEELNADPAPEVTPEVEPLETNESVLTPTVPGHRGRVAKVRAALIYPTAAQWTVKDILSINPDYEQPTMALLLKQLMLDHKVKPMGQSVKAPGQRGKASNLYSLAA